MMINPEKFIVSQEEIRRITLVGPMEHREIIVNYWHDQGYRVIQTGPFPISVGKVDPKKFRVLMEKDHFTG